MDEFFYLQEIKISIPSKLEILFSSEAEKIEIEKKELAEKAKEIIKKTIWIPEKNWQIEIKGAKNSYKAIRIPISQEKNIIFTYPITMLGENASYYLQIKSLNNQSINKYKVKLLPFEDKESNYLTSLPFCWKICFLNLLFYGNVEIWEDDTKIFSLPILVYPEKIKIEQIEKIIRELLEWHSQLIYDLEPTGLTIKPGEYGRKNPIQMLNFIRYLFKKRNIIKILNSIIENPHKILIKEEILKEIYDVKTPVCHLLPELATESTAIKKVSSNQHHFEINNLKYQFVKAYDENSKITHDTYPNRFVKFFLKFLKQGLVNIEEEINLLISQENNEHYKKYFEWLLNGINPSLKEIKALINRILNHDFFKEVSDLRFLTAPPQTLLKEYRYREIFSAYLDLIKGISLAEILEELLKDPIRNMPELYEYWCFLKLWKELEEVLKEKGKSEISFAERKKGIGGVLKYSSAVKFRKATLIYNRTYNKNQEKFFSYSVPLRPDFSLEIDNNLILFDAKYRVEWYEKIENLTEDKISEIKADERLGTFILGDLYKMHTYREAIINKNKQENRPLWVIALYPGTEVKLYSEDKEDINRIKNIKEFLEKISKNELNLGGVGAIPLTP